MNGHEKRDDDRFKDGERRFAELKELCEEIKDKISPVCEWVAQNKDAYVKINTLWDERNKNKGAFNASGALLKIAKMMLIAAWTVGIVLWTK